ncbi:MAG: alpha/beta hydrolase [Oscillospiraceae bacterium]|jgi:acetyl esterase/lipase|nr:alpha/beta hydrolase [Oscillospiraceae bacterium]
MVHEVTAARSFAMKRTRLIIKVMGIRMGSNRPSRMNYAKIRKIADKAQMMMPVAKGVSYTDGFVDGVEIEVLTPAVVKTDNIIFHIHGGGFTTGSVRTSRGFASFLADMSRSIVYTISYRCAPENPYPAGFDDCFNVYKHIAGKHPGSKIALCGESAGGNLAIALGLRCVAEGVKKPSAIIAYSAALDCTGGLVSHAQNAKTDIQIGAGLHAALAPLYAPNQDLKNPYLSPIYADDLTDFPPTMLVADVGEILYDDSVVFAEKLEKAGIDFEFYPYKNAFHAFPPTGTKTKESMEVLQNTISFINAH